MKKNLIIWAVILVVVFVISTYLDGNNNSKNNINFSDFISKVDNSQVLEVKIKGNDLNGTLKDGSNFYTYLPYYPNLIEKLYEKGVAINSLPLISKSEKITAGLVSWLPFLIMIGLWIFFKLVLLLICKFVNKIFYRKNMIIGLIILLLKHKYCKKNNQNIDFYRNID